VEELEERVLLGGERVALVLDRRHHALDGTLLPAQDLRDHAAERGEVRHAMALVLVLVEGPSLDLGEDPVDVPEVLPEELGAQLHDLVLDLAHAREALPAIEADDDGAIGEVFSSERRWVLAGDGHERVGLDDDLLVVGEQLPATHSM